MKYNEQFFSAYHSAQAGDAIMSGIYTIPDVNCVPAVYWVAFKTKLGWQIKYDFESKTLPELKRTGCLVTDRRIAQKMTNCCLIMLTRYCTTLTRGGSDLC